MPAARSSVADAPWNAAIRDSSRHQKNREAARYYVELRRTCRLAPASRTILWKRTRSFASTRRRLLTRNHRWPMCGCEIRAARNSSGVRLGSGFVWSWGWRNSEESWMSLSHFFT